MPRYDDYRRSTGTVDMEPDRWDADRFTRERRERRGPPVFERPRRVDEERFESRLHEIDRYGPPARRPDREYEDDHLIPLSGPLVHRPRVESPPPPPLRPRLLRRQSSLDTFDRIPSRKLDEYIYADYGPRRPPSPPPMRRRSMRRSREADYYEDIRIADPDFYGDEEFRGFRERTRGPPERPARPRSHVRERVVEEVAKEKPYPRKGKTRMPRKLVHTQAVREFGYPYLDEGDRVIIQVALSKEQIDDVIKRSREIRRRSEARIIETSTSPVRARPRDRTVERLAVDSYSSPRSSSNMLIVEASPSRHPSRSRYPELEEKRITRTVSRTRSVSVHGRRRRRSSPVLIRPFDRDESEKVSAGPLAIVVRPRDSDSDDDLGDYLPVARRRRSPDYVENTEILHSNGDVEEVIETKKDRAGPNSRIMRAMMATLT